VEPKSGLLLSSRTTSPVVSQNPRLRSRVVLTDLPAVTVCLRGKRADMLELLHEIEQNVRSDNVLPDGFSS